MKIKDIRELTLEDIEKQIVEAHKRLFDLRFNHAKRQLENVSDMKKTRHLIAQLKTVYREKELDQLAVVVGQEG